MEENKEENLHSEEGQEQPQELVIDQAKLDRYIQMRKSQENFPLAVIAGLIAAVAAAIGWAAITVLTGYQIVYLALVVGFIVGMAIRVLGKGMGMKFAILGAVMALFGSLLGNYLTIVGLLSDQSGVGFFQVFSQFGLTDVVDIMTETFGFFDIIIYGLATYAGFSCAADELDEEEIIEHAT